MAGGTSEVFLGGKGFRLGDGAFEEGLGFGEAAEMNERIGAVVEESGILCGGGDQGCVEGVSFVELIVAAVETGEETSEVGVLRMGCVELFYYRDGLIGFVLRFVKAG